MQDEDIIPLEALDLLRNASDELLSMATCGQIVCYAKTPWALRNPAGTRIHSTSIYHCLTETDRNR
jgi:hypothetical protein